MLLMDKKPDDGLNKQPTASTDSTSPPRAGSGQASNKMEGEDLDSPAPAGAESSTPGAESSSTNPPAGGEQKPGEAKPTDKQSLFARIRGWRYLYLALFA